MTKTAIALAVSYIAILAFILSSWIFNIYKLFQVDVVQSTEFILRIVGIFVVPMGVVLGWIGHF
jgi:uncharacterized protein YjeT (DUF2065 family)